MISTYIYMWRQKNKANLSFDSLDIAYVEEPEYDVFICYSSDDTSWVTGDLLPYLEDICGLRCCIHERDFKVPYLSNNFHLIKLSYLQIPFFGAYIQPSNRLDWQ